MHLKYNDKRGSIMVDHATHLKAVNHPIRREILRIVYDSETISKEDLLKRLKEKEILDKEDVFNYNMDFLIKAECISESKDQNGKVVYTLLPAGKVIENF